MHGEASGPSPFEIQCDALRAPVTVLGYRGREAISRCFTFDVDLAVHDAEPEAVAEALLGSRARLVTRGAGERARAVAGMVRRVRVRASEAADGRTHLEARISPRLWALGRGRSYRIFQRRSVSDIVRTVLDARAVPVRFVLPAELPLREYCVQYDESDLAFVERLLAEEGLSYCFDSADAAEGEVMVVSDGASPLGDVEPDARLRWRHEAGLREAHDAVLAFALRRRVEPRVSLVRGFDYLRPHLDQRGERQVSVERDPAAFGRVYRYVGTHPGPRADAAVAQRRLEQDGRGARIGEGRSQHIGLEPGRSFSLIEGAVAAYEGRHHLVAVEHRASTAAEGATYENVFTTVPDGVVARPPAPERRVRQALETAIVVGPPGQEIHTDELGRIKVQFHWDLEGTRNEHSSCWIRALQPWAGAGWGFQFIPRVGMEVVVGFLGGDPDAPVVLGAAYNAHSPPAYPVPSSRTRSGIKTRSSRGGDGYNEIAFEDRRGHERLLLRAERDLDVSAQNDEVHRVGRHLTEHVQGNRFAVVVGNTATSVSGSAVDTVTGDRRETTQGSRLETVQGNAERRVHGREEAEIEGDRVESITGADRRTVTGPLETVARGGAVMRSIRPLTTVVGTPDAPASATLSVEGSAHAQVTRRIEVAADERVEIACGDSRIVLSPDGIELHGKAIRLAAEDAWMSLAEGKARTHAEKKVVRTAKKILDKAEGASLSLSTEVKIDGQAVKLKSPDDESQSIDQEDGELTTIALVDQLGRPVPRARYRIALADGSTREGLLDDEGRAELRIEGAATITFPDRRRVEGA